MRCLKCGNAFTDNGSSFCSPEHRRKYERKNKLCSYPSKRSWSNKQDAQTFIDRTDGLHLNGLRPFYDPSCKHWHIGHSYSVAA
jgi:hypothetical protein